MVMIHFFKKSTPEKEKKPKTGLKWCHSKKKVVPSQGVNQYNIIDATPRVGVWPIVLKHKYRPSDVPECLRLCFSKKVSRDHKKKVK